MLSFSFQVWRYSPSVAMSLLSAPSVACQSPSACMMARSSAHAYFLEMVVGRSEMWMLNSRGARTYPRGTPFLRRRDLLLWPFLVVSVKLRLPTISMIMWTMCLSGKNHSSLQLRWRCHTVSEAAVWLTNTAPAFFLSEKLSAMSCVNRVTWSTADHPCRKPTCSCGSNGSMIVLTSVDESLEHFKGYTQQRY